MKKYLVMFPNNEFENLDEIQENKGSLSKDPSEDKLMRSVANNDKKVIDDGTLILEAMNQSISTFNPDIMFQSIVENFKLAKEIFGEKLLREITGYDLDYIDRNKKIPEFKEELKKKISARTNELRKDDLIDHEDNITEKALSLSALIMYTEELDKLQNYSLEGKKDLSSKNRVTKKGTIMPYKKGSRYKDINLRSSIKTAIRRNHLKLNLDDIKINDKDSKSNIEIIYAIDASASMKGKKIEMAKKAGIALSFNAIQDKNKIGLIIFGDEIKDSLSPSTNFKLIINSIARIKPSKQTDFAKTIKKAYELFTNNDADKHLFLITDSMPTVGENPVENAIEECYKAKKQNINISIIGINLSQEGINISEKITAAGEGKLNIIKDVDNLDLLILEEYNNIKVQ
jgi:Mg-chelatase subunit ChlD